MGLQVFENKKLRYALIGVLFTVLVIVLITGILKVTSNVDNPKPVELRIVTMFGGIDPAKDVFEQQLAEFQAANPHITIINDSMTSVGDGFRTLVKSDFSMGTEGDIIFFYNGADIKNIIESGGVVSYDEIWEQYPEVGSDVSEAVKTFMLEEDGRLYCLPLTGFYEGLFVNEAIFEAYDLELPNTWEHFLRAVDVLSAEGIVPIAGPLSQSYYLIEHFILAESDMADYKSDLSEGVPKSWVEGLNQIKAFYEMGAFPEDAFSVEIEVAQNMFRSEEAAMIFEGSWFIGGCDKSLRDNMTVVAMPPAPNSAKNPSSIIAGYSSGYYISRKGYDNPAKQQAIIDLVTYLTSSESIKSIAEANGGTPSSMEVYHGLEKVVLDGHTMVRRATEIALPIDSRLSREAFNAIASAVPYIIFGEREAEDVMEDVKRINME